MCNQKKQLISHNNVLCALGIIFNVQHNKYRRAGNFRKVYISRSSRFDQIRESLSREFVNITIQTHKTSTQIAKLKPRKCLFKREIAKFYSANIFHSTVIIIVYNFEKQPYKQCPVHFKLITVVRW